MGRGEDQGGPAESSNHRSTGNQTSAAPTGDPIFKQLAGLQVNRKH